MSAVSKVALEPVSREEGHRWVAAYRPQSWSFWRRLGVHLVVAMLVVSVPLMLALTVLLTRASSASLTTSVQDQGVAVARSVTLHVEDWLTERQEHLQVIAVQAAAELGTPRLDSILDGIIDTYDDYDGIQITDLDGRVLTSTAGQAQAAPYGGAWLGAVSSGKPSLATLVRHGDGIRWIMAQPVLDAQGRPVAAVVADLSAVELTELLDPELGDGINIVATDAGGQLVYDTAMGDLRSEAALVRAGMLGSTLDNAATRLASTTGEPGVSRFSDRHGDEVIGGFDILDDCGLGGLKGCMGWTISAEELTSTVLAPAYHQRTRALLIVCLAILVATAIAVAIAVTMTRPIRRLTDAARQAAGGDLVGRVRPEGSAELTTLGQSFNAMLDTTQHLVQQVTAAGLVVNSSAAELSASSDQLAATTTQQSAAVTEATTTTEELARASSAIADTVDEVASQTAETRENMEQAEADIALSSERTLILAQKVNEIDGLLDLINEIADQTNLLALNAAIEAARAGENGLGFAVVADEVRRLAERSKTSAGEINTIIRAVQGETAATVMAMEKGAKQMARGLLLLEAVTDANAQVRMTTQQQRSATSQVVETMEQLNDSSRQISATANEVATAAGKLADLAGNLESSAKTAQLVGAIPSDGRG